MKKSITIEWDDETREMVLKLNPKSMRTLDIVGILEFVKLRVFEDKQSEEDDTHK